MLTIERKLVALNALGGCFTVFAVEPNGVIGIDVGIVDQILDYREVAAFHCQAQRDHLRMASDLSVIVVANEILDQTEIIVRHGHVQHTVRCEDRTEQAPFEVVVLRLMVILDQMREDRFVIDGNVRGLGAVRQQLPSLVKIVFVNGHVQSLVQGHVAQH